jgi:hypothetical protein
MLKDKRLYCELPDPGEFMKLSDEDRQRILQTLRTKNFGVAADQPVISVDVTKPTEPKEEKKPKEPPKYKNNPKNHKKKKPGKKR